MPSSTSSSDAGRRWATTWLVAAIVVGTFAFAWELAWRDRGFTPSLSDDRNLWVYARRQARGMGHEGGVLVGSSRMQMDIHRDTLIEATGWESVVQLAAVRGASVPTLRNLAADASFRGTVVCEINPVVFFGDTPRIDQLLTEYVAAYEESSWADALEQRLRMHVQNALVSRLPNLAPLELWRAFEKGAAPRPRDRDLFTADRFRYRDYQEMPGLARRNATAARLLAKAEPHVLGAAAFAARLDEVEAMVAAISARGGRVVFVRLPSSMHVRAHEARWFPKPLWWDVFRASSSAEALHFEDVPALATFNPLDGSHLDVRDAKRFSRRLGALLSERNGRASRAIATKRSS